MGLQGISSDGDVRVEGRLDRQYFGEICGGEVERMIEIIECHPGLDGVNRERRFG